MPYNPSLLKIYTERLAIHITSSCRLLHTNKLLKQRLFHTRCPTVNESSIYYQLYQLATGDIYDKIYYYGHTICHD